MFGPYRRKNLPVDITPKEYWVATLSLAAAMLFGVFAWSRVFATDPVVEYKEPIYSVIAEGCRQVCGEQGVARFEQRGAATVCECRSEYDPQEYDPREDYIYD